MWKTDFDFELIAGNIQRPLIERLSELGDRVEQEVAILDDPSEPRAQLLAKRQRSVLATIQQLRADPVDGLNRLAARLLHTRERKRTFLRELDLADELTSYTSADATLPSGFWLVAYQAFEPVLRGDAGVGIYFGSERRTTFEVSPLVSWLHMGDARRPKFYVYYVSDKATEKLRVGRHSRFGAAIVSGFIDAFPLAATNLFGTSTSGSTPNGSIL